MDALRWPVCLRPRSAPDRRSEPVHRRSGGAVRCMEARSVCRGRPERVRRDWRHLGHLMCIKNASRIAARRAHVRSATMQYPQAMHLTADAHLLHSFLRDFSRSLTAHSIQPLPPKFPEATPQAASREAGETARFWKARFPRTSPCDTLGRWIRSPPNPRGSDLAVACDHYQATPSRAKAARIPAAGLPTGLQPWLVRLPGRPGRTHPCAAER